MKALIAFATCAALASAVAARPSYGGGHHTSSHGGRYSRSYSGSSHKGGSYHNVRTSNRYGTHKR